MAVTRRAARRLGALCAVGSLAVGAVVAAPMAAVAAEPLTITLDPTYQGPAFQGWGTSLAWFAEATGDYPDALREALYEKVFGEEGLNLNIARYNIGGGNSTDTPTYMRLGASAEGWWTPDLPLVDWDPVPGTFANKATYVDQWNGASDDQFNFDADQSQRWWIEKAATERDDMVWEAFSNSPPWFMTPSGYVSGPLTAGADQLNPAQADDFANYLVRVVEYLEDDYGIEFNSIDPFNQPSAPYPRTTITNGVVSGRQEGAPMGPALQQTVLGALHDRLTNASTDAVISATDASQASHLLAEWDTYSQESKDSIAQLSVHSYRGSQYPAIRDIGKATGKNVWQSEVDGSFGTGYSTTDIQNGIGFSQRIIDDMRELEPDAWIAWQAVEDLRGQRDLENTGWGAIYVDLDCNAEEQSLRRIAADLEDTQCYIETNAKYNAMRNFTHFIRPGDRFIPTSDLNTTAALDGDGVGADAVHVNNGTEAKTIVLDLSRFGSIAQGATVTPMTTTESPADSVEANALVQGTAVAVNASTSTATVTVPAKSITTFVIEGVSGVAADAHPLGDGGEFSILNGESGLVLSAAATGATVTTLAGEAADAQRWTVERLTEGNSHNERVVLRASDGRVLAPNAAGTALVDGSDAAENVSKQWMLTTTNGKTYSFVSADPLSARALTASGTTSGAAVGVARSDSPTRANPLATQAWTLAAVEEALVDFDVTVATRCIAGKNLLQVTVRNTDDAALAATVASPYGTKAFEAVQPTKNAFHSFTTRQANLPGGDITVTATIAGQTGTETVAYPVNSCG